jgi:hypothetical protein
LPSANHDALLIYDAMHINSIGKNMVGIKVVIVSYTPVVKDVAYHINGTNLYRVFFVYGK